MLEAKLDKRENPKLRMLPINLFLVKIINLELVFQLSDKV